MRIIQLSDIHVVKSGNAFRESDSIKNLIRTIDYILEYELEPDVVVVSGDVSNDGTAESYFLVDEQLKRLGCPYYVLPGNHDDRLNLKNFFGDKGVIDPGIDADAVNAYETDEACLLFIDSTIPKKEYGCITLSTLKWLDKALPKEDKPTIVFMHHIPFETGYVRMDDKFQGHDDLLNRLVGRKNAIISSGHIHTGMIARQKGVLCLTCPSVTMMMSPDFTPLDGDTFYVEPAAFAIHDINGTYIRTDFCTIPEKADKGPYRFIE